MNPSHTLPTIACGWLSDEITVGSRRFRITRPAEPDVFLDDPEVLEANRRTDYMPYWSYLWPAAPPMAKLVAEHPWTPGMPALEIGCGIGLVGLAGLSAGLNVTFSDYDAKSIRLAQFNAAQNGFADAQGLLMDWRRPQERRFPIVLGCEVIYENQLHPLVLNVLEAMLADDGECWIGDPGRHYAPGFYQMARDRGYAVEVRDSEGKVLSRHEQPPNLAPGECRLQVLRRVARASRP